jgi:gluconate 2-dehydrogenase gamma chain
MRAMDEPQKLLSTAEERILSAIAERIFPKSDTPGAVEIGAVDYIQIALAGDYAPLLPLYRRGLRAVKRHAKARFAAEFLSLNDEQQDLVLKDFESGAVPGCRAAAEFFETVHCHVLEGIFCEPHYGGNKNMMGWRLVDFPGQQFGYPDPYINKRVDLEPVAVDDPAAETKSCRSR